MVILSFIFTGCSSYSITKYFDKDEFYNKAIQYTKKADIKKETKIQVMMNATYLNSVKSEYNNDKENFIVGLYIVDDENNLGLKHPTYTLLLNEKKPSSIEKINIDDFIVQNIPLKNNWAQYYFVSFDKEEVKFLEEENDTLILSYKNIIKQAQKASVTFLKEL